MQASNVPGKFSIPWANGAGSSYVRQVPTASQIGVSNGAASMQDGFPPNCFVAVAAGGAPPWGQDMNGILRQVTQWGQWQQAGAPIVYDSTFQSQIGGYPAGAIVQLSANGPEFMSTVDNNTVAPAVGVAGWMPLVTFGGNVETVSATGTLTAVNAGLVLVNAASGNITLTMPAVASENGTPLPFTFIRTDSSSNTVTLTAAGGNTFSPGGGSSFSLFSGVCGLTGDGASVWRWTSGIQSGSNANGWWRKYPDGTIEQGGNSTTSSSGTASVTFPIQFPNTCEGVLVNERAAAGWSSTTLTVYGASSATISGVTIVSLGWSGSAFSPASGNFFWRATGY
jgi:hypothetical protein